MTSLRKDDINLLEYSGEYFSARRPIRTDRFTILIASVNGWAKTD